MERRDIQKMLDMSRGEQLVLLALLVLLLVGVCWRLWLHDARLVSPVTVVRGPEAAKVQIDLNSAPWHDLVMLPGIGPTRARQIVELRNGKPSKRFAEISDLSEIKGVSTKVVEGIRPYVCLRDADVHDRSGAAQ